jgi:subtilisin family serine protease
VHVTDLAGGAHAVDIEPADPESAVQTAEVDGDLMVLPQSAMQYLAAGVLDQDLFNVTQLIEFGYDDASVAATPLIVEYAEGPTLRGAPLPGVEIGTALESIGGAAATADHASAASTWNALTGASGARAFSTEVSLGGGIEAIHLDGKVHATLDSSVPYIGAPEAWAEGYTGDGVTVAVLDTGYDDTHPDLAGRVLPDSTSFVPGEEVASDPNGHGTHVASTIAGTGAASGGTHRGVADGADLLVGKVLGGLEGSGQDSWIIEAMQWAGERADIVSMSLGSSQASDGNDPMSEALNTISEQTGALFVVAAGNQGAPETIGSPGSAARALTVGSVVDPTGELSYFSSQGPLAFSGALKPEIAGPGSEVTAARSADSGNGEGDYITMSGTSMATPHVAGAAAILLQRHPEYSGDELRAVLAGTATDVGLSSYLAGAGVVDVDAAIDASIVATGSGDFGMLSWDEEIEPVVRPIEYTNHKTEEVVLDLAAALDGASEGVLVIDADHLTIPAGESRTVTLTADPGAVPAGTQYSGALVASIDGQPVARTALGIIAEPERYDLTVTATDFDGEPTEAFGVIWDPAWGIITPFLVSGETTMRLPGGHYSVMSFLELDREADTRVAALVGDPDLDLDEASTVAFDARTTKPVTVDVGDDDLEQVFGRIDYSVDGFTGSYMAGATTDELYAQPLEAPDADTFSFSARWRLQQPTLALTAGKEELDLIAQAGSSLFDGKLKAGAVDAGTGSVAEFAAVDVRGKVAVVTRSNEVAAHERAANALAAGAALLLVVNDEPGELSEWVGADDYRTEVGIPVASVSGVQGARLLESLAAKKVTVTGLGIPTATEVYDIARHDDGSIPEELDFRPTDLARIDTTYYGDTDTLVGEFRWDYSPGVDYVAGILLRTSQGIERTEWVNTGEVEWYQGAHQIDAGWEIRDMQRAYAPGEVLQTSYFGPIVRPFVGPGYWAPNRTGDYAQVNVPSWADGGSVRHTGALDIFSGMPDRAQLTEVWVDGELKAASPWQSAVVWELPDGESEWRVRNTATHDGTYLDSSTSTVTEWTFRSTGTSGDYTEQILPMLQAYYDVDFGDSGIAGVDRHAGDPVGLRLELGHLGLATGIAEVTGATLEMRVAGSDWQAVELADADYVDDGAAGESDGDDFVEERAFVEAYTAELPVPDGGAWVDLRVTGQDAAGNTFSQEIVRAFEVAAAKTGGGHGQGGIRP